MFLGFSDTYFFHNSKLLENSSSSFSNQYSITIYEVIKIMEGIPLFFEDHIGRLHNSMVMAEIKGFTITNSDFFDKVKLLCNVNNKFFGNIELRISKTANNIIDCNIGFIPHKYPNALDYINGVKALLMQAERKNPTAKVKHTKTRIAADKILEKNKIFEVLLVNSNGIITEGSRSNVFFIKGNIIYTAYNDVVLSGITRKYVVKALERQKIKISYNLVNKSELEDMDAVFICGTSPGIIPLNSIDSYNYNVNNKVLRNTILKFNSIVQEYLRAF